MNQIPVSFYFWANTSRRNYLLLWVFQSLWEKNPSNGAERFGGPLAGLAPFHKAEYIWKLFSGKR